MPRNISATLTALTKKSAFMMKYCTCFLVIVLNCFTAQSQIADTALAFYSDNFPAEKLHLHTDKTTYLPGETIWFKAYILADDVPTNVSTNLYADLLDAKGKLIAHKTMPVIGSTADSYFKIPDTAEAKYTIRAYTTWMLNFDTAFIYHKTISVISNTATANNATATVSLQFFAEGGNLVSGLYNYVAFKATQNNGQPYNIKAAIKNSKGELEDSIESMHNGMGIYKFTPENGEIYIAEWKDNKGEYRRTALPAAQPSGIVLHTEQVKNELYYLINTAAITDNLQELTVLATINQKPVYNAALKPKQTTINQKINTKDFATGILQLTVFDKNNQPLAERIVFINNNNYTFTANVSVAESSTKKRGKNKIEIEVPDTLSSNLSIAVYDAGLEQEQSNRNIYTDLLLQGDLRGDVYNASWYFDDNTAEAKNYLDLVMQTNGWRRYNWSKVIAGQAPGIIYPRDNYLSIYGKATGDKQQPKADEMISLIVQTADSAKQWYMPVTGKDGLFTQSGVLFYDTATVFYKLNNSKDKTTGLGLANNYNGLISDYVVNTLPAYLQNTVAAEKANTYTQAFVTELKNKNPGFEQSAKILNEVVVKSGGWRNWKNDPLKKMDDKYASMFRGGAVSFGIDVLNDEMALAKQDIFNYLMGKIPMVSVTYNNGMKSFTSITNYYINESEIPTEEIYFALSSLKMEDIAYIKMRQPDPTKSGVSKALLIYLKKPDDLKQDARKLPSNLSKMKIGGYSPVKEFYSPDYGIPDAKHSNADLRTTLLWQPYIITDKANKKVTINFYNNDITTKLKVVVEGMNTEGKIIHIEKIIE